MNGGGKHVQGGLRRCYVTRYGPLSLLFVEVVHLQSIDGIYGIGLMWGWIQVSWMTNVVILLECGKKAAGG